MKISKDLASGLMFIVLGGGGAAIAGADYAIGTAGSMGPGYFPVMVGALIAMLGAGIAIKALLTDGFQVERFHLRPMIFVLLGVIAFALLVEPFGLIPAVASMTVVATRASNETCLRELPVIIMVLCLLAVTIFIYGLGMPLEIWSLP